MCFELQRLFRTIPTANPPMQRCYSSSNSASPSGCGNWPPILKAKCVQRLWLDPFCLHFLGPLFAPLFGAILGKRNGSAMLESVCGACMHAVRTDVWLHRSLSSKIATRGRWAPPRLRAIQLEILICLWGHFQIHFSFTLGFTLVEAQ